ncbi:recombinase family protein [Vibrio plantisponsor]|uniref:recombinase family protein n=1 Tax=Vibrio plantisponsor TaxID=664643 RepID=UPI00370AE386
MKEHLESGTIPELYSYSRVSTGKQLLGSGKQQQKESLKMQELSERFKLPISARVFEDDGKSAFHGKNLDGALGAFIDAVDSGEVAKGSILAVFSLDRISRQNIIDAQTLFVGLLRKGIKVYTAIDDKLYGDNPTSHFTDLIMSMVYLERANNESVHKSERTIRNAKIKIKKHVDGERGVNGYALSIESVGNHVWWVMTDPATNEVIPRPHYFEVAKDICSKLENGWGTSRIITYLNEKVVEGSYPPPLPRKNRTLDGWSYSLISSIHKTGALMGERLLTIEGNEYVLKNYYPPVLTEEQYFSLKLAREERAVPRGSNNKVNFISGINVAHCRLCGGSVGSFKNKHGNISYRCLGRMLGRKNKHDHVCSGWSVTGGNLERLLLEKCKMAFSRVTRKKPTDNKVSMYRAKLEEIAKQKRNLVKLASLSGELEEIHLELVDLSEQKKLIENELNKEISNTYATTDDLVEQWQQLSFDALDINNNEARLQVRELIQQSVERIEIQPISKPGLKRKFIAIVYFRESEQSFRIMFTPSIANEWVFKEKGDERSEAIQEYYAERGESIPDGLRG